MRAKTLRVQSGSLKGRALEQPKTSATRPTKSIVKGCVFNILRPILPGAEFIEAFGGSASMAVEAISNGAAAAHVCEINTEALRCARKNCAGLEVSVHAADAFEAVGGLVRQISARGRLAVVYLDPPFGCREGFAGVYERLSEIASGADLAVVEHESAVSVELAGFSKSSVRKFGKTSVSFFEKNNLVG